MEGCKGHTHKGHREKVLKVMNSRDFPGCFQGDFRVFLGYFMEFQEISGHFQGVFPYALSGYALWTLSSTRPPYPHHFERPLLPRSFGASFGGHLAIVWSVEGQDDCQMICLGCTPKGSYGNTFSEGFSEGFLEGVLQ